MRKMRRMPLVRVISPTIILADFVGVRISQVTRVVFIAPGKHSTDKTVFRHGQFFTFNYN